MVGGIEPLGVGGQLVTGNYFQVLGVEAARGRTFTPDEGQDNGILPGYFSTVGIPILKGRDFTDADREGAPLVAIVNRDDGEAVLARPGSGWQAVQASPEPERLHGDRRGP